MTTQPDLFASCLAEPQGGQLALFDFTGPPESSRTCAECGEQLVRTPSGYLCCPKGHGKLLPDPDREQDCPLTGTIDLI